jgi:hypothetical protein
VPPCPGTDAVASSVAVGGGARPLVCRDRRRHMRQECSARQRLPGPPPERRARGRAPRRWARAGPSRTPTKLRARSSAPRPRCPRRSPRCCYGEAMIQDIGETVHPVTLEEALEKMFLTNPERDRSERPRSPPPIPGARARRPRGRTPGDDRRCSGRISNPRDVARD